MSAHVVAFDKGIEGTAFRCEHCTLTYSPPMPMPLAKYIEQAKGFGLMHRGCEKPVVPSKQLRLPHHDYEVDPAPDPDRAWAVFNKRWPQAHNATALRADLSTALQGIGVPSVEEIRKHHPESGTFHAMAHWARLQIAHMNHEEYPDVWLPDMQSMPGALEELVKPKKKAPLPALTSKKWKLPKTPKRAATAPNGSSA